MKAQLRILSGARAGQVEVHSRNEISAGRHASCDVRFHPDHDLDVSIRHALISRTASGWAVRDLQSRNGTFVNGHRIAGETRLSETDQIRFGTEGPTVEFRAVADSVADTPPAVFPPSPAGASLQPFGGPPPIPHAPPPGAPRATGGSKGGTTQRIKVEVARQTHKLRVASIALVAALVLAAGGFFMLTTRQEREREAEAAAMRARVDSVLDASDAAVRALQGRVAGLADALQQSQTQVQRLQTELAGAQVTGDRAQIAELSRRLTQASDLLRNQQAAAQLDYRGIVSANQRSIALLYVEFEEGETYTGTAFAVRPDGILVTNRHVVAGEDGTRKPRQLAIKFTDSYQVLRASVVIVSIESDLAAVRVDNLSGTVPVVRSVNLRSDTVQVGDPVATIGFPLGVELPMGSQAGRVIAKPTFGAGTVTKTLPDRMQIDGYSAQGASGSPIFDRNGEVVAVLFGGHEGTNGRVLYAIPAGYITKLLQSVN